MAHFSALVLSAVAVSPSFADDPAVATYKVTLRDRWKAGDVATLTANEKREKSIVRFVGGKASGNPDDQFKEKRLVDQEVVAKCVEVDANGAPSKKILWFASFSHSTVGEAGPERDGSLEKVFVQIDGVGAARTVTILSPDAKVSPRAMRWLEAEHGKGERFDALCAALEPKEPMAVGATVKLTGDALATATGADDAPIDAEKSSAEVTLASVDGEKGGYHLVVSLASTGRLVAKAIVPWKSGGARKLVIRSTRGLAADAFDTTGESEEELEGATAESDGETRIVIKSAAEWVVVKGGTMPEIPKAGAVTPDPAAPKADAPKPDK